MWIDLNKNGSFETNERLYNSGNQFTGPHNLSTSITIPLTASNGLTRMRIINDEGSIPSNPCLNSIYGETEDYLVNIVNNCSGTPLAGTISAPASVCPNDGFQITNTGASVNPTIRYAYQTSIDGITFTNIPGQNTLIANAIQSGPRYYRMVDTCITSGASAISNVVYVGILPADQCYCSSNASDGVNEDIFNVTFGTLSQSSNCSSTGTGSLSILNKYSDYTNGTGAPAIPNLVKGTTVPITIQIGNCAGSGAGNAVTVWIDFNKNKAFENTEKVYSSGGLSIGAHFEFGNITISNTSLTGYVRMRIVNQRGQIPLDPCGTYLSGETEDYLINIKDPPSCDYPSAPVFFDASNRVHCQGESIVFGVADSKQDQQYNFMYKDPLGGVRFLAGPLDGNGGGLSINPVMMSSNEAGEYFVTTARTEIQGCENSTGVFNVYYGTLDKLAITKQDTYTVDFRWKSSGAFVSYDYEVTLDPTPPGNFSPQTSNTWASATIVPGRVNYIHVRVHPIQIGSGSTSCNWRTIIVCPENTPKGFITPESVFLCTGAGTELKATGGNSYQWFRNGTSIPGATASTYTATQAGVYSADLIGNGCTVRASNESNVIEKFSSGGDCSTFTFSGKIFCRVLMINPPVL